MMLPSEIEAWHRLMAERIARTLGLPPSLFCELQGDHIMDRTIVDAMAAAVAELKKTTERLEAALAPRSVEPVNQCAAPPRVSDEAQLIALVDRMVAAKRSRIETQKARDEAKKEHESLVAECDAYHDVEMRCRADILAIAERRGIERFGPSFREGF